MDDAINLKGKLLAEQVQEQIFQYILKTPVALGDRLPNGFELGEKFGVGRSTVWFPGESWRCAGGRGPMW